MNLYSVKQIAEMLGTNEETVRRWIRDKKLKAVQVSKKSGNIVEESDLQQFLSSMPKYMARVAPALTLAAPALGAAVVGTELLIGTKGYIDKKKSTETAVASSDLEQYFIDEIIKTRESIAKKKASIETLLAEIRELEENLQRLDGLYKNNFLEAESNE